jgi:adenine-specific DNA glycosylase
MEISGLSRERIALAATLGGSARSFQPTRQTARIANRVFKDYRRSSRVDHQLALTRFIGALHSGEAYGALLEVGDRFCLPSEPRCEPCPLRTVCATGQERTEETYPRLFSSDS